MSRQHNHILLVVALLLIGAQDAVARSSRSVSQRNEMRWLSQVVEMYREIEGEYPIADANSTWYEKLRDGNYTGAAQAESTDGSQPLDLYYDQPLILVPPSAANGNQIIIRAVGPNGIDDGGALDDWDSNAEPNIGYWYKTGWLAAKRWAWVCMVLAIVGAVLILWRVRQGVSRVALVTLWWGVLGTMIAPRAYHFGLVGSTGGTYPPWMGLVVLLGIICVAISLLAAVEAVIVHFQTYRHPLGYCRRCRYDLRGAIADQGTCPECGEPFTLTARSDEDARPQ